MLDPLLGQHLQQRTRSKDDPDTRRRDGQPIANGPHVHRAILPDRPIDDLPLNLRGVYLRRLHLGELRLLAHCNPGLLRVQNHPVHLLRQAQIRQACQGDGNRKLLTACTLLDALQETPQRVIYPRGDKLRVRRVLVVAVEPLTWLRPCTEENFHAHGANDTVNPVSESDSNVRREPSAQAMKPQTAANKLGLYLPATPEEFQNSALTHEEFVSLQKNPPEWLQTLRREGPHPRKVVAQKLGISNTALKSSEISAPLTTAEIKELLADQPEWLAKARKDMAAKRAEHAPKTEEEK